MSDITLRSLYPEDIQQVCKIENSLTGSSRRVFLEKRLAVATAMPAGFITCAALDGEVLAGYGFARILEGEFGAKSASAILDTIGVDPGYQGKGIGKFMLENVKPFVAAWPAQAIRLDAYDHAAGAGEFYFKCGFTEKGRIVYRNTPLIYFELLV